MFHMIVEVLNVLIIVNFIPLIQKRCHLLEYIGVTVSIAKFDVDDGISLSVP